METSIKLIASHQIPTYFSLVQCEGLYEYMYTVISQVAWCFISSRSNVSDYVHYLLIYCLTCNAIQPFSSPKAEPATAIPSYMIHSVIILQCLIFDCYVECLLWSPVRLWQAADPKMAFPSRVKLYNVIVAYSKKAALPEVRQSTELQSLISHFVFASVIKEFLSRVQ